MNKKYIEVQGHRGERGLYPENTIPSFLSAVQGGASSIELDVLLTSDHQVIIHHNFKLNPDICINADGSEIIDMVLVKDVSLADMKLLDCGTKNNLNKFPKQQQLKGLKIPTLSELLNEIHSNNSMKSLKRVNIEIKRENDSPNDVFSVDIIAKTIFNTVLNGPIELDRIYFSSFDFLILEEIRRISTKVSLGFITDGVCDSYDKLIEKLMSINIKIISPNYKLLKNKADVEIFQKNDIKVIPWTVNNESDWDNLVNNIEVDGIITDYPSDLVIYLNKNYYT